jgi:hypothetical protein
MGRISVGPGEGGGEAWDDGGELLSVDAGDAVGLSGEDAADRGPILFGSVPEHGDVMAREAEAELGGAQGVREDAVGVAAEGPPTASGSSWAALFRGGDAGFSVVTCSDDF